MFDTKKLIFLDGAMGTMLQHAGLKAGELPELRRVDKDFFFMRRKSEEEAAKRAADERQKDIDAEWDGYKNKLVDLGLNRMLELRQKVWDL